MSGYTGQRYLLTAGTALAALSVAPGVATADGIEFDVDGFEVEFG